MPVIISVTDMINNFSEVTETLESNKTVFITKNGKGAYAIMSMEAYDALAENHTEPVKMSQDELEEIYRKINEAEKDFQNGQFLTLDKFKSLVRRDYEKI